jgi:hypothetical protein
MRILQRMMAALTAVLVLPVLSFGQAMSQVPTNAMVVVHVKNLQDLSTKAAALATQLGLPANKSWDDTLGYLTKHLGLKQGVNNQGDFALALLDTGQGMNGPRPPLMLLMPVSDYQAALANYPNATTDGAISTIQMPDGNTGYAAKWGDYMAISAMKDCVAATPGGLVLTAAASKQVDSNDVCLVVNMPGVRTRVLPLLMMGRQQVIMQMGMGLRQSPMAKYASVFQVMAGQFLDVVQNVFTQCDDVTVALNLAPEGIHATYLADFKPDSHYGQLLASEMDTDQSLLGGLPDAKYIAFGGSNTDAKVSTQLISEFVDPISAELTKLGPDGQPYVDMIQAVKDIVGAQTGKAFGMLVPEGELGAGPLMQLEFVIKGDAKSIATAMGKMMVAQQAQVKLMATSGLPVVPMQITYTPAAKTVDGVTFDQMHTGVDMGGALTPQTAKISQYLSFLYGQDGINFYSGVVNDTTYLQVGGVSDDKISAAIAAAKSGDDVLGKQTGVQSTAAQLPKERLAAFYVPVDTIVNTVFTYMGKFGLDMGVTMPASDPIGITLGTEGSAVRGDLFVPNQLLTNGAQMSGKLMAHKPGPGGPGGAGPGGAPPAGGGL